MKAQINPVVQVTLLLLVSCKLHSGQLTLVPVLLLSVLFFMLGVEDRIKE